MAAKGGGSFPGRVAQRGVSYVSASQGRQTAVILIVAILLARLVLTKQLQTFWSQVWQPMKPLGAGLPGKSGQTTQQKQSSTATGSAGAIISSLGPIVGQI